MNTEYDIIVIGGGHAGIEAAHVAVRAGARVALVTFSVGKIGEMSCNPAIGGLAKGQIVCEIDALGGLMAQAADATGIQFRMLNRSKGPAVWGPRAQVDRKHYATYAQNVLCKLSGLDLLEGEVAEIRTQNTRVTGIVLADGRTLNARAVVLAGGTFLNGLVHIGEKTFPAGRIGENPARLLTDSLRRAGLRFDRMKTGTCPRLLRDSIDFDRCELQPGDDPPIPFSMLTDHIDHLQVPCHLTHTNPDTHRLLRENLHRAPLYTGQIQSTGPRYCPSIEVKIVRFESKSRHQVYLEPETLDGDWIYCNGLSTSVPESVQEAMVHSIVGLERAKIVQFGYAIEYDYLPPDQLGSDLQSKSIAGLFFAGQINGTSGYEEAAGQGLMAGLNATRFLAGKDPVILGRDEAYIGVMIDDLVTRGIDEPYRMFTSRAEFRLRLRADTAERRLCPIALAAGILDEPRRLRHDLRSRQRDGLLATLDSLAIAGVSAAAFLRRPENDWTKLQAAFGPSAFAAFDPCVCRQVEADVKYSGYQDRERRAVEKLRKLDAVRLPPDFDYAAVACLPRESREKLSARQPATLGQASRISGITPADIMLLLLHLKK